MNVKVELTEGYAKRFTEACCRILAQREKRGVTEPPKKKEEQSAENRGNKAGSGSSIERKVKRWK